MPDGQSAAVASFARTQDWLDAARATFAPRISEIIEARSASSHDIGLGFVPSQHALHLALGLCETQPAPDPAPPIDPLRLGASPIGRLLAVMGLPGAFSNWAALMLLGETDARWGTLFAWLNDDASSRAPSVDLAFLIAGSPGAAPQELLSEGAVLRDLWLIEPAAPAQAMADQPLRFVPYIRQYLLGDAPAPADDPGLRGCVLDVPDVPAGLFADVAMDVETSRLVLIGSPGSGRVLCAIAGLARPLCLSGTRLSQGDLPVAEALVRAVRQASLQKRCLVVTVADALSTAHLAKALTDAPCPVRLTANVRLGLGWPTLTIPNLTRERATALWQHALDAPDDAKRLAHQYRLPALEILRAARSGQGDIDRVCLERSARDLDRFAHRIETTMTWDDLVLPARQTGQLRSIAQRHHHARTVYDSWGFGQKIAPDQGITALFSGSVRRRQDAECQRRGGRDRVAALPGRSLCHREQVYRGDRKTAGKDLCGG